MSMCRTCLKIPAERDIPELEKDIEENTSWADVLMFCLNVMIPEDSKLTMKLCDICFNKITEFYKFKMLSLKNDAYLKTLEVASSEDQKHLINEEDISIKQEDLISSGNFESSEVEGDFDSSIMCKVEIETKNENMLESDEEPLSEVQKIKNSKQNIKENAPKSKKRIKGKRIRIRKPYTLTPRICEECGKSVFNLKEHMAGHVPKDKRDMVQCKLCPKQFYSISGRNKHYRYVHLGKRAKCDICNREVLRLSEHKRRVHNPEALPFGCPSCDRRFEARSNMEIHMNLHTHQLTYECDTCQKKFHSKGALSVHRRQVHEKERRHQCEVCSKAFFGTEQLKIHLTSHSAERPYICNECGKRFANKNNLYRHSYVHNDVKSYRCDVCEKTFKSPIHLRLHKHSHNDVKPYPCRHCDASFARSDRYRRHVLKHHPQLND